jgi:hypothetical protein
MRPEHINAILAILERISATERFDVRTLLIYGIEGHTFRRSEESHKADLHGILQEIGSDRAALDCFLTNAKPYLEGRNREFEKLQSVRTAVFSNDGPPGRELASVEHFDLQELVRVATRKIRAQARGLIGLAVHCPCDRVVDHVLLRMKDRMAVASRRPLTHKLSTVSGLRADSSERQAIEKIQKAQATRQANDVVCGVAVFGAAAAETLWRAAQAAVPAESAGLFVLFMVLREGPSVPAGMEPLPSPEFLQEDIEDWWRNVTERRGWGCFREIVSAITSTCADAGADVLDMDVVYNRLQELVELLKAHDDEVGFRAALSERLGGEFQ